MTWCQCRLPSYFVYSTRTSPLVTNRNPISSACLLGLGERRMRQRSDPAKGQSAIRPGGSNDLVAVGLAIYCACCQGRHLFVRLVASACLCWSRGRKRRVL